MKNTLILSTLLLSFISCGAQTRTIANYNGPDIVSGDYIKDMDNDFNAFVGTWKWENGTTNLTLQFQKITKHYNNTPERPLYDDYLIGEYKYVENGVEKVNSLPIVYSENQNVFKDNAIAGSIITTTNKGFPPCNECAPNTRFIILSFGEKENEQLYGKIRMAHFLENGVNKIRARITNAGITNLTKDYTGPRKLKVPEGIYTFIKQ